MGIEYQLTVKNDSPHSGNVCVYQTIPSQPPKYFPLAWFSKTCHPNTTVNFKWTTDHSFFWAKTGFLRPGVVLEAVEQKDADPLDPTRNAIGISKQDGEYRLVPSKRSIQMGMLGIYLDGTIAHGDTAVGIGMGGQPTFAVTALPNYIMNFFPHPVLGRLWQLSSGRGPRPHQLYWGSQCQVSL